MVLKIRTFVTSLNNSGKYSPASIIFGSESPGSLQCLNKLLASFGKTGWQLTLFSSTSVV